jgi:anti-sigma-K factor RskA
VNSDIHALSGAYVVDALDDLERARFEKHLADCADCREEVRTLTEAASLLGGSASAAPPADLRDRVLADIATVRPLPPVAPSVAPPVAPPPPRVVRRRRWPELVAAAAAVVALVAGITVWQQPWEDPPVPVAEQVLSAPDASKKTISLAGGAQVTLIRSTSVGKAVVETKNMPSPPSGKVYELWLQTPQGKMEPAGVMPVEADQTFVLAGDAATAVGAGITVEPAGGSKEPSTEPIALFDFKELA